MDTSRAERRRQKHNKNKKAPDSVQVWTEITKKSRAGIEYKESVPSFVPFKSL